MILTLLSFESCGLRASAVPRALAWPRALACRRALWSAELPDWILLIIQPLPKIIQIKINNNLNFEGKKKALMQQHTWKILQYVSPLEPLANHVNSFSHFVWIFVNFCNSLFIDSTRLYCYRIMWNHTSMSEIAGSKTRLDLHYNYNLDLSWAKTLRLKQTNKYTDENRRSRFSPSTCAWGRYRFPKFNEWSYQKSRALRQIRAEIFCFNYKKRQRAKTYVLGA